VDYGSQRVRPRVSESRNVNTPVDITHLDSESRKRVLSPLMLCVCGFRAFSSMCITVLRPLVWSTPRTLGGLGFDPYQIGLVMGIWGCLNALFLAIFLGPIMRRIGAKNVLLLSFMGSFFINMMYPLLSFFSRTTSEVDVNAKIWVILVVQLTISMMMVNGGASKSCICVEICRNIGV
jgi:MFS family permease